MDGSPYFLSMRNNLSFRERKKSRGSGHSRLEGLLDWNEFIELSNTRAEGINLAKLTPAV
jgi:hypothetical protein